MPFLLALFALWMPRLVIILLFLFSDYLGRAFDNNILPFLGFLLLPFTTLAYAFAKNSNGSVEGVYIAVVVVAVLMDLGFTKRWFRKKSSE